MLELVAAGQGIALQPRAVVRWRQHPGLHYLAVDGLPPLWQCALAWRRGARLSHAARAWLALAQEHFHNSPLPPDETLAAVLA